MRLDDAPPLDLSSVDDAAARHASTTSYVVMGAGGHGRELADIIRAVAASSPTIDLLGLVDDGEVDRLALARAGFRFLGNSDAVSERDVELYLGLGYPAVRRNVANRLHNAQWAKPIMHPSAELGAGSQMSTGSVLAQGAIVTTNVSIGEHTHVGVGSTISHDCTIGDFVTICPGVTITGTVTLASDVFVGAGATILPGVSVGRGAVIGAGATVIDDIAPLVTAAGVPARIL